MKLKLPSLLPCSFVVLLTVSVQGQENPNPDQAPVQRQNPRIIDPNRPQTADERSMPGDRLERFGPAEKASDVIGMEVRNKQNEKLGKVEDLAVNVDSGRIVQVILSAGGIAGFGDTLYAVPPGALHHDRASKVLHLDVDRAKLKASPKFETSRWAEHNDSNHIAAVYRYYGQEPWFSSNRARDGRTLEDTRRSPNSPPTDRLLSNADRDRLSSGLGEVQKASKLDGTTVKNLQDESIGKVDEIMVDLAAGRILALVVSSGGFLGLGNELSAIPPTAFRFNSQRDALQLDATKESLAQAPHFKADQWPDFTQPAYAEGLYRAHRVDPYFDTNSVHDADNTARNVRDRQDRTLTPTDQGNSKAEIETTASIRKEILATKGMSVSARNVKVITINGRVTLRGPVETAAEKTAIASIAKRVAGEGNVDDLLEVKLTPTGRE